MRTQNRWYLSILHVFMATSISISEGKNTDNKKGEKLKRNSYNRTNADTQKAVFLSFIKGST